MGRRYTTRNTLTAGSLALLLPLLLAACGDDDDGWIDPDPSGVPILPLGDSITQADADHLSYRYALWWLLVNDGYEFDFVGSETGNHEGNPIWLDHAGEEFDRNHEGHWGWHADEILDGLPTWLEGYTADIALIHIGTNDANSEQPPIEIVGEIEEIIEVLRDDNPTIVVLLAKLIPIYKSEIDPLIDEINLLLEELAAAADDPQSPVVIVDQNSEFDVDQDTYDGIHPNAAGEVKVANRWLEALGEFL